MPQTVPFLLTGNNPHEVKPQNIFFVTKSLPKILTVLHTILWLNVFLWIEHGAKNTDFNKGEKTNVARKQVFIKTGLFVLGPLE